MTAKKLSVTAQLEQANAKIADLEKKTGTNITGCHFGPKMEANEHTRASVVALAEAISMNAQALIAAANALKGGDARMDTGLFIGSAK